MNVATEVLDELGKAVINQNALTLVGQLDRKLYEKVNKVLDAAGGKWNRKAKAHLFDGDASEIIEQIILTGKITNKKDDLGQFFSPRPVVDRAIKLAEIKFGMKTLEPNSGRGAIAGELVKVTPYVECYEIDPANAKAMLDWLVLPVTVADFLTVTPEPIYDRVVMNPPFAKRADIAHVRHAFKFLKPGGRLVSIMSAGVEFRTDRIGTEFRTFIVENDGFLERLPEGSFLESGTGVNTVIVVLKKSE